MSIREFSEAAELLIDSLSTFTATELMEYEDFVALTVLAGAVGCDRKAIKEKVSRQVLALRLGTNSPDPRLLRSQRLSIINPSTLESHRITIQIQLLSILPITRRGRTTISYSQSPPRPSRTLLRPRNAYQSIHPDARELQQSDAGANVPLFRRQRSVYGQGSQQVYRKWTSGMYDRQGLGSSVDKQACFAKQECGIRAGHQAG